MKEKKKRLFSYLITSTTSTTTPSRLIVLHIVDNAMEKTTNKLGNTMMLTSDYYQTVL